jgi:uncharacterized protein (TIGR03083 family)
MSGPTTTTAPRPTTPQRACTVAGEELAAFLDVLHELDEADWQRPTDCPGWTVRDVVAHVTGAMEEGARLRVQLRHLAPAPRRYPALSQLDAVNQMQVDERRTATPAQLVDELATLGPRAARARRRMPGLLRRLPVPGDSPLPDGATFAYLVDVIYPRDLWMHRIDVERATDRPHTETAAEGFLVAEVVRDLADTWEEPPVELTLTGAGGGSWQLGTGDPVATLTTDTVQLCRRLSGRDASPTVTGDAAPEVVSRLLDTRIAF